MDDVTVKVLFFAKAAELTQKKEAFFKLPSQIESCELLQRLCEAFSLSVIKDSLILAKNEEYISLKEKVDLKEGDEIALIPPLSGADEVVKLVKSPKCGAVSLFLGTTRDNFDGLKVKCLKYDAYEGMALKEMEKICSDVREQWPSVVNIAIWHRLGEVPVTETSVLIAISSPHRQDSLDAVNFTINTLKSSVPIWKKEEYHGKPGVWKVNKECPWAESSLN